MLVLHTLSMKDRPFNEHHTDNHAITFCHFQLHMHLITAHALSVELPHVNSSMSQTGDQRLPGNAVIPYCAVESSCWAEQVTSGRAARVK